MLPHQCSYFQVCLLRITGELCLMSLYPFCPLYRKCGRTVDVGSCLLPQSFLSWKRVSALMVTVGLVDSVVAVEEDGEEVEEAPGTIAIREGEAGEGQEEVRNVVLVGLLTINFISYFIILLLVYASSLSQTCPPKVVLFQHRFTWTCIEWLLGNSLYIITCSLFIGMSFISLKVFFKNTLLCIVFLISGPFIWNQSLSDPTLLDKKITYAC